jgi:hypothetical protein
VPEKYEEDPALGEWAKNQRPCYEKGIMDPERKRRLDELGFDFNPRARAKRKTGICSSRSCVTVM